MLSPTKVKLLRNPWEHTIPTNVLDGVLQSLAEQCAKRIETGYNSRLYSGLSFAIVVMDPTCPPSVPSTDAVLAIIEIGGESGSKLVVNGLDKACELRDTGYNGGQLLFGGASYVVPDGGFRWGHAARVGFLIGGGSGLDQIQDRYETTLFLAGLEMDLCKLREQWEEDHPTRTFSWFCDDNLPHEAYQAVLNRVPII